MTQRDINEMASECGLIVTPPIEAFAKLVAAKEREACAKEADKWSKRDDDVGSFIGKAIRARGEA